MDTQKPYLVTVYLDGEKVGETIAFNEWNRREAYFGVAYQMSEHDTWSAKVCEFLKQTNWRCHHWAHQKRRGPICELKVCPLMKGKNNDR